MNDVSVVEVKGAEQYDALADMLYAYVLELHTLDEDLVKIRDKEALKNEYFWSEDTNFYLIYTDDTPIGFAVIGINGCCHPLADIYINEFYIKPEYRNQGFGEDLFDGVIQLEHPSSVSDIPFRICLYIIKNNKTAIRFWNNLLSSEWINVTNQYSNENPNPEYLFWYMYEEK